MDLEAKCLEMTVFKLFWATFICNIKQNATATKNLTVETLIEFCKVEVIPLGKFDVKILNKNIDKCCDHVENFSRKCLKLGVTLKINNISDFITAVIEKIKHSPNDTYSNLFQAILNLTTLDICADAAYRCLYDGLIHDLNSKYLSIFLEHVNRHENNLIINTWLLRSEMINKIVAHTIKLMPEYKLMIPSMQVLARIVENHDDFDFDYSAIIELIRSILVNTIDDDNYNVLKYYALRGIIHLSWHDGVNIEGEEVKRILFERANSLSSLECYQTLLYSFSSFPGPRDNDFLEKLFFNLVSKAKERGSIETHVYSREINNLLHESFSCLALEVFDFALSLHLKDRTSHEFWDKVGTNVLWLLNWVALKDESRLLLTFTHHVLELHVELNIDQFEFFCTLLIRLSYELPENFPLIQIILLRLHRDYSYQITSLIIKTLIQNTSLTQEPETIDIYNSPTPLRFISLSSTCIQDIESPNFHKSIYALLLYCHIYSINTNPDTLPPKIDLVLSRISTLSKDDRFFYFLLGYNKSIKFPKQLDGFHKFSYVGLILDIIIMTLCSNINYEESCKYARLIIENMNASKSNISEENVLNKEKISEVCGLMSQGSRMPKRPRLEMTC